MPSRRHAPPLSLLLACALLCAGCGRAGDVPRIVKEARHANGLTVGVPEDFEAKATPHGFDVEPSGSQNRGARYPVVVSVWLIIGGTTPDESVFRTRSIGGREVRHRVTKREGGSGGEVYTLSAYELVRGGHIRYMQVIQSEQGEPDFALCWALVGSAKYQPENN